MKFVKMHGIGNDYVYLDAVTAPSLAERPDLADLARSMSDRHTGVGSDGLILVCRPIPGIAADVRMRMFNSDGSESEMCGNGIRCVAKFAHDRLGVQARPMRVETGRGVLSIDYTVAGGKLATATVDMGEPILEPDRIPVDLSRLAKGARDLDWLVEVGGTVYDSSFVSMGNPHAVVFTQARRAGAHGEAPPMTVAALKDMPLRDIGPLFEHHPAFPRRINAHFAAVQSPRELTMRTWERGAGTTMACGTGACAVLVAGVRTGRLEREVLLHLPGGDLTIRWDAATNHVFKTGPATDVFEGEWPDAARTERGAAEAGETSASKTPAVATASLNTPRLVLRPFTPADAPEIAALCHEREIAATTLLIPHPYTLADAERWIRTHPDGWTSGTTINFAVTVRPSGPLVGAVGLTINRDHARAEIGYWIGKPFWGRGYATEAARAVVHWGFESLGLERIFAYHFAKNAASGRVLRKIGMTPEGLARRHVKKWGEYHDSPLYSILRGEPLGEPNAAH